MVVCRKKQSPVHMFQRCLICTDFSDGLHRLVKFVPSLAAGGIKQIVFLHSVPLWEEGEIPRIDQEAKEAQENLQPVKAELEQLGVKVVAEVRLGNPYEEVLDAALEFDISAIAISSDTLGKLIEWTGRSFAGELMHRSWHPILFFPPPR